MKNKILFTFLSLAIVFGVASFSGAQTAHAQVAPTFPVGCTSNLGYSVTNGTPCSGTGVATLNILGCATALGYSVSNGAPCDGNSVAISYLYGCTSLYGFSTVSGDACNGTASVSSPVLTTTTTTTPGLPVTGAESNALVNMVLILALAAVAILGSTYLVKKYNTTS